MIIMSNLCRFITTTLSVFVSLTAIILTLKEKPSKGQMYFSISICSTFAFCICSYMEITAWEVSAITNAVKLEAVIKLVIITFFAYFFTEYNHMQIRKAIQVALWSLNVFIMITIMGAPYINLFYRKLEVRYIGRLPYLAKGYGPVYYLMIAETYSLLISCFIYMISRIRKTSDKLQKRKNALMLCGLLSPIFGAVFQVLNLWKSYDIWGMCYTVSGIFFIISIKKYHMFDMEQNAKEYILDNTDEAVIIINTKHEIIYYNPSFARIYSDLELYKTLEELSEKTAKEKELKELFLKLFDESISLGNREHTEQVIEFAYHEKIFALHVTSILRKNKSISGYLMEVRDITDEKNDLKRIDELTKAAENANKLKSAFLANMSHEIRTPINAILGMDEMIIRESEEKNIQEYANNIRLAGRNLLSLVNDILDFSKLESGKMELVESEYDTESLIKNIYQKLYSENNELSIDIRFSHDSVIPRRMYGDAVRVEQLILNIFISFMKICRRQKLEVKMSTVFHKEQYGSYPKVVIKLLFEEKGRIIRNHDFDIESVQKNYYEKEEESKGKSNKLELSAGITEHLLTILDGTRSVFHDDKHTELEYTFPQGCVDRTPIGKIDFTEREEMKVERQAYVNANAKVLVVDDNAVNLKVMQGLLKRTQVRVVCAKSGMECLEKIREDRFDLIFMDHQMPGMDGIETLNQMKQLTDFPAAKTAVIALTANAFSGAREMYINAGFTDYLTKPVDGKSLENVLETYLS